MQKGEPKGYFFNIFADMGRTGVHCVSVLRSFGTMPKNNVFRSFKNLVKIFKNLPWDAQGSILSLQGSGKWCIFGQEVPGDASRARTSKEKNDRGAAGGGSDTPWAVGPATL